MPKTLRLADREIAPSFSEWANNQRKNGVRLICVEGVPGAGKSWMLKALSDTEFRVIELDSFLPKEAPHTISWVKQVTDGGAVQTIRAALEDGRCVLVEGPAVWPVVMPVVETLGRSAVRRVYIKRMSKSGSVVDWLDGEGLLERAETAEAYWRSIYDHHGRDQPWLSADLIIERVPEE